MQAIGTLPNAGLVVGQALLLLHLDLALASAHIGRGLGLSDGHRLRRHRLTRLCVGIKAKEDEQPRVAKGLERGDRLAHEQRGEDDEPAVARHGHRLKRHRGGALHQQEGGDVDEEAREAREHEHERVLEDELEGVSVQRERHLGRQGRWDHPEQAHGARVVERLDGLELEVLEQLLRDHQPKSVRARGAGHEEDADDVEVDLARRRDSRAEREAEDAEDNAARGVLDAHEAE
mmetsp:Transcript_27662/g.59559  ORF Transcript_27662/g.59559 Transcript_27662/m.59559 type:complete len:233 (-) Transcript_27662:477-1175(-)